MGKNRRYFNRFEMLLSSQKGKRALNVCYNVGASVVIIGALFKILHVSGANEVLGFAMIVESLVFFVSAFERPNTEYHWEEVFPVLSSKNPLDRPEFDRGGGMVAGAYVTGSSVGAPLITGNLQGGGVATGSSLSGGQSYTGPTPQESVNIGLTAMGLNVTDEDAKNLANSIQKLGEAADQIAKMADLTEATQTYIDRISTVSQNLDRFNTVTNSLSDVSDSLVNSCKAISGSATEGSEQQTLGYVQQMEQLNQNLSGLNQFYEAHLNGLRTQMDTIHHINAGLNRIRDMYDSSVMDSAAFRNENERMAQLLSQLNQVYGRLLQAMTVNMPMAGNNMGYPPQQPNYPNQPYGQPPYNPMR